MEKKCYLFEEWKDIPGYEGLYQASSFGRIKSLERIVTNGSGKRIIKERIIIPFKDKDGYNCVGLHKNSVKTTHKVHRLVAVTWIPNPQNLPCVNHKDEDKTNNVVSNLEWCDRAYNNSYGSHINRCAEKHKKTIFQYSIDGKTCLKIWESASDIEKTTGWNSSNITSCCRSKQHHKTAYGYIWRYAS